MNDLTGFKHSFPLLQKFMAKWFVGIQARCKEPVQRQAAFCIWARYSMSMNTIAALLDPHLLPDFAVICRGCIEFDASLRAVIETKELAQDYLDFAKHAKANYLRLLSRQGDIDRMLIRRKQFEDLFKDGPEKYRRTSWYKDRGVTGLLRSFGSRDQRRMYNMLSHLVHGSVWGTQMLEGGITDPESMFEDLLNLVYVEYLVASQKFLTFIWKPLTTPQSERCKADLLGVLRLARDAGTLRSPTT